MEDLKELYDSFEMELKSRKGRGAKADKIRSFVENASGFLGKKRMAIGALYDLAKDRLSDGKPLDKAYFTTVIKKHWMVEVDENHIQWVLVDRPRGARS